MLCTILGLLLLCIIIIIIIITLCAMNARGLKHCDRGD